MPRNPRRYDLEYKQYGSKPKQKKNRAKRNAARRKMIKAGRARKGDGKDIDHRNGIAAGNGNGNLRVMSKSANRSYPRNKDGSVKKRKK